MRVVRQWVGDARKGKGACKHTETSTLVARAFPYGNGEFVKEEQRVLSAISTGAGFGLLDFSLGRNELVGRSFGFMMSQPIDVGHHQLCIIKDGILFCELAKDTVSGIVHFV
jgi:hypothetical protein